MLALASRLPVLGQLSVHMKYIDNGPGTESNTVLSWLMDVLTPNVVGVSWQSGFFEGSVLGALSPTLTRLAKTNLEVTALIGSNNGETKVSSVRMLAKLLALPRSRARLGIVSYANGFYHPKTIHVSFDDGREAAYVGSANLTTSGIDGTNIEAGIVLDTSEGDSTRMLNSINQAAVKWFELQPEGLYLVNRPKDIEVLKRTGVLSEMSIPRSTAEESDGPTGILARRRSAFVVPRPAGVSVNGGTQSESDSDWNAPQGNVLVAELSGPGRWSQAAFPKWFIDNFFEVQPGDERLRLLSVTKAGVGELEMVACGHKPGSKNWYYELKLATEIGGYPRLNQKPIGLFLRIEPQSFRYTIIMPDSDVYPLIARCLAENLYRVNRPNNENGRTIISVDTLQAAWPDNWFLETRSSYDEKA